jgi:hypothetical protein
MQEYILRHFIGQLNKRVVALNINIVNIVLSTPDSSINIF